MQTNRVRHIHKYSVPLEFFSTPVKEEKQTYPFQKHSPVIMVQIIFFLTLSSQIDLVPFWGRPGFLFTCINQQG